MAATPEEFNPSKIIFSDEDYKKAAKNWKLPLLQMPLLAIQDILQYMSGMGNVRYKVALPTIEGHAQFGPYNAFRKDEGDVNVKFRELETYCGSVIKDFEPNAYIQLLIGQMASALGDGQKNAPSAQAVIGCVMKSLGYNLRQHLFDAVRNASGTGTADLFDGWMTIINKEITAGEIATGKGNYQVITETVTKQNAVDIAKEIERGADPYLRRSEKFLYCSPEFADLYNDCYKLTSGNVPYNKQYEQMYVEGSGNKTTIIPLDILSGSDKFILTPKANMLYGFDTMSDLTRIQVDRFSSFILTLSAVMFFGTQIYTLDKRYFKVIKFGSAVQTSEEEE